jgi:hypothetical protein
MRATVRRRALALALCGGMALCYASEGLGAEAVPPGLVVSDPASRAELSLPGGYWQCLSRSDLARQARGGCAGQVPPELLLVAAHKDAPAQVVLMAGRRTFLMRSRDGLEAFIEASGADLARQLGKAGAVEESSYEDRDGVIVHRFAFSTAMASRGGAQAQQRVRGLAVDCFLRPAGEDARHYQIRCIAPEETYAQLEPEIEHIAGSFRFTGELAGEFFDAAAPPEKVLKPEDAVTPRGRSPLSSAVMVAMLALVAYLIFFRRKKPAI